jgi:predicted exporter
VTLPAPVLGLGHLRRNGSGARVRRAPLLLALAVAGILAALAFTRVQIRTDMAAFLPAGQTPAARFMLQELQSGSVASLILIGIENAPAADLARISTKLAAGLDQSGQFALVSNGAHALDGADEQALFDRRLLLSPATTPQAFTPDALKADLARLLQALQSSAAPLAVQFGLPDPIGAFPAMGPAWIGASKLRRVGGVWFAPERDRALLLVQTRAGGMDIGAQDHAQAAIQAAFAAADPGPARLLASGPAVFAQAAAQAIRADVRELSIVSALLVMGLLLWRFRSPWVIVAIAVPITISIAAAALAVQLVFGFVHGIALGFGMTMLGVTVDYPVLLIGHRKLGESAAGTLRRIGQAFRLAVLSASLGLTGMVFCGFPGVAQLGLFAVVGVVSAAVATRFVLPRLIVAADLAPVPSGDPAGLLRVERLRRFRWWGVLPVLAAGLWLLVVGGPRWEGDTANLSPVPQAARDLDASMRQEIGAPEFGEVLVVRALTAEAVLERQEALFPAIDRLQHEGGITGFEAAARLLPSAATQTARQAALPDAATLRARLDAARSGTPFRAEAFAPFEASVAAARAASPVQQADLTSPALAARLSPLLFERDGEWFGPIAFTGGDPARIAALAAPGAMFVDTHAETNRLVNAYTARAGRWLAYGGAAALVALLLGLRQPLIVGRIVVAIASSTLVTVALLTLAGVRLSLLHLVALQFTIGVGLDYALFYARRQLDEEERARTLRTLVTCNLMTLLTFGLLALCQTPLLRAIGVTVAIGAVSAMVFSFLFVGLRPDTDAT